MHGKTSPERVKEPPSVFALRREERGSGRQGAKGAVDPGSNAFHFISANRGVRTMQNRSDAILTRTDTSDSGARTSNSENAAF